MAVTSFDCNKSLQLTKNFNTKEFKCKAKGHIHNTLIDTDFVKMLQDFMNKNGYTKAIISSAYRCPEHNRAVGGSSASSHTQGRAVDISFYKDGKVVPAKEVCCKSQDYGFKGIAYIDANHVHLDNRVKGTYRGDERKGYSNNVPNGDFYAYFDIPSPSGKYNLTRLLKKGDKGSDVKELQKRLEELGYSVGKWGSDGSFGNDTQKAVKKLQKKRKIFQDGIVGKDTAHALGWKFKGK
jgi:hypothetical protein